MYAFKEFILDNDFDLVAVTESWLKSLSDYKAKAMCPHGYDIKHVHEAAGLPLSIGKL